MEGKSKEKARNGVIAALVALGLLAVVALFFPFQGFKVVNVFWGQRKALCFTPFGLILINLKTGPAIRANSRWTLGVYSSLTFDEGVMFIGSLDDKKNNLAYSFKFDERDKTVTVEKAFLNSGSTPSPDVELS